LTAARNPQQAQIYAEAAKCVTLIHPDLKDLVNAIWAFDWGNTPESVRAYINVHISPHLPSLEAPMEALTLNFLLFFHPSSL
jgi:hypothetical protein